MRLNAYLRKTKTTQREFANKMGVSPALVSAWVLGTTKITPEWAIKIEAKTDGVILREQIHPKLYRGFVRESVLPPS